MHNDMNEKITCIFLKSDTSMTLVNPFSGLVQNNQVKDEMAMIHIIKRKKKK